MVFGTEVLFSRPVNSDSDSDMLDITYNGIKIIISSFGFRPEAQIRGQQISKELSWTWKRTLPQISFQPADFELNFVVLKYELAAVGIKSRMV